VRQGFFLASPASRAAPVSEVFLLPRTRIGSESSSVSWQLSHRLHESAGDVVSPSLNPGLVIVVVAVV
jgi:hypothetical protein